VKVQGTDLSVIEYKGQRVVTLAMIDKVHNRVKGTARKRFNDNRKHFVEGTDYFNLSASEIRTPTMAAGFPAHTRNGLAITEAGYMLLVKSLTDDLSWKVQTELRNVYFQHKELTEQVALHTVQTSSTMVDLADPLAVLPYRGALSLEPERLPVRPLQRRRRGVRLRFASRARIGPFLPRAQIYLLLITKDLTYFTRF
jgi:hypothetical protein